MQSKVNRISAEEARELLERSRDVLLLDVRQPEEYEKGHIPGAVLIPLPELPDRLSELKRGRDIVTYCRLGRRSLAAAHLIADELDAEVYTIDGGIMAWNGFIATGDVMTGLLLIENLKSPEEFLSFAYTLEDGSERFYLKVSESFGEDKIKKLFKILAEAEVSHKKTISEVLPDVSIDKRFIDRIESGIELQEVINIILEKKSPLEAIEYAMQIEINSLDLYMRMVKTLPSQLIDIFRKIIDEEKNHLRRLGNLLSSLESGTE
jgi:rhodanese-related sulfurtransferase/rubrerythrin